MVGFVAFAPAARMPSTAPVQAMARTRAQSTGARRGKTADPGVHKALPRPIKHRATTTVPAQAEQQQYWLMKSEGAGEGKFSIDDLAACPEARTPWDGVRNYAARNFMKAMKCGDLAFFYHSNCKVPGIAGVVRVVKESYPDPTQFDKGSKYYDAKSSSDEPRWFLVDVQLVQKFARLLSLEELKGHRDRLPNMMLFTHSRLSVQRVHSTEWEVIINLSADT
ncbi:Thymocyte nuclear protein 1 [Porphyridium purpureum]|uniref:Thymocyte nuclear protein 1 n=1 Tax=Porphyridium purpureum TaxID=35688 RepID=A0A5J4YTZ4_PORPP|nr:Thymocyte nuclear protein 1 [Porphyridium purpureum]|eukprot:POR8471..scf227_4